MAGKAVWIGLAVGMLSTAAQAEPQKPEPNRYWPGSIASASSSDVEEPQPDGQWTAAELADMARAASDTGFGEDTGKEDSPDVVYEYFCTED